MRGRLYMPGQRHESGHKKLPKIVRIPSTLHHKICQFTYRNMPLDVCLSSVFTLSEIFSFITMYFHDISSLTPIFILHIFYKSANQVIDFPNNRKNKKHHYESNNTKHNICKLHCTCIGYFLTDFNCKCND